MIKDKVSFYSTLIGVPSSIGFIVTLFKQSSKILTYGGIALLIIGVVAVAAWTWRDLKNSLRPRKLLPLSTAMLILFSLSLYSSLSPLFPVETAAKFDSTSGKVPQETSFGGPVEDHRPGDTLWLLVNSGEPSDMQGTLQWGPCETDQEAHTWTCKGAVGNKDGDVNEVFTAFLVAASERAAREFVWRIHNSVDGSAAEDEKMYVKNPPPGVRLLDKMSLTRTD